MPLALAHTVPLHPHTGIVAQRQTFDELLQIGRPCSQLQPIPVNILRTGGNIAGYCVRKEEALLHDGSGLLAPHVRVQPVYGCIPHLDLTPVRTVEAQQQFQQRSLATAEISCQKQERIYLLEILSQKEDWLRNSQKQAV